MRAVMAIAKCSFMMICGLSALAACATSSPQTQRSDTPPLSRAALQAALDAPGVRDAIPVAGRAGHEKEVDKLLASAVTAGNPVAQTLMGDRYRRKPDDHPSPADLATAAGYYRLAAQQGYVIAEMTLGRCYRLGDGVTADKVAAAYWYRQAARQNNPVAKVLYGVALFEGEGVAQDKMEGAAAINTGRSLETVELQLAYGLVTAAVGQDDASSDAGALAASILLPPRTEQAIWWGLK